MQHAEGSTEPPFNVGLVQTLNSPTTRGGSTAHPTGRQCQFARVCDTSSTTPDPGAQRIRPCQRIAKATKTMERATSGRQARREDPSTALSPCPTSCFSTVRIPAALWSCSQRSPRHGLPPLPVGEVLFIDARNPDTWSPGKLRRSGGRRYRQDRCHHHARRNHDGDHAALSPGSPKRPGLEEINKKHDFVLTPGRYVGTEEAGRRRATADKIIHRRALPQSSTGTELEELVRAQLGSLG